MDFNKIIEDVIAFLKDAIAKIQAALDAWVKVDNWETGDYYPDNFPKAK